MDFLAGSLEGSDRMRALRSWSPRARVAPWKWMGMAWYPDSGLKVVMFRLCMNVWKVTKQWRRDLWGCKEGSKWSWRTRTQYVGPFCKRKSCCIEYWRRLHGGRPIALWHHTYGGHCGSEPRTPLSNFGLLLATTYYVLQSTSPVLFQYYCVTKNCKMLLLPWKVQHSAPRLWFQFQQVLASPCFARASKSDTWTSPFCTCQEKRRRTHLLVDPAIIWRFHSWTRLLLRCRSYMGFSDCNCAWNLRSCNVSTNNIPVSACCQQWSPGVRDATTKGDIREAVRSEFPWPKKGPAEDTGSLGILLASGTRALWIRKSGARVVRLWSIPEFFGCRLAMPCGLKVPALRPHMTVSVAALGASENITANVCSRSVCTGVCISFFLQSFFLRTCGLAPRAPVPDGTRSFGSAHGGSLDHFSKFSEMQLVGIYAKTFGNVELSVLVGQSVCTLSMQELGTRTQAAMRSIFCGLDQTIDVSLADLAL